MALQLNITYLKKDNTTVTRVFNISPNDTFNGTCGVPVVTLRIGNNSTVLQLKFGMNATSSLFFLQEVQLNMTLPDARDPAFSAFNRTLRALQAMIGNSYKCNTEEHLPSTLRQPGLLPQRLQYSGPSFQSRKWQVWVCGRVCAGW
ncbi:Lysosome-associated membrane glycoprotein 1 [Lemmus lemmus]